MGAHVQVGLCADVIVDERALAAARITKEEATRVLSEFVDLSLFAAHEDDGRTRWSLRGQLVEVE